MPQLPSGRHVGLSAGRTMEMARQGNFNLSLGFAASVKEPSDLAPLIDILYYHDKEGEPPPGEPYYSGLTYLDVTNNNCDWSMEDIQALAEHVASDRGQAWLRAQFDEMAELIRTVKAPLPESLHGLFD